VDEELHRRLHVELNKQGDERAKIFTTIEAVAQPKPAGAK
jgi:hypothetical protein